MKGQTLLLADDSVTTHRVVELTFAEHGLRVVSVSDGQQAIERLSVERPDIVLAAVNMPKADGYQVAEFVRSRPSLEGVPVLLLAGAFDAADDERVRQSGAAGILVKPFEPGAVITRVKELLGVRAKEDRPAGPPAGRLITPSDPSPPRPPTGPRGVGAPASARPVSPPSSGGAPPGSAWPESPPSYSGPPPGPGRPQSTSPDYGDAPSARSEPRPNYGMGQPSTARTQLSATTSWESAPPTPAWDQLREATGLGPDARHVEGPAEMNPDDYFERLDAAFDSLDAQLSGRSGPPGRGTTPPPAPRLPASIDPAQRRMAPQPEPDPQAQQTTQVQPVFEVDSTWFADQQNVDTEAAPAYDAAPADQHPAHQPPAAVYQQAAPQQPTYAQPAPPDPRTAPAAPNAPVPPVRVAHVADAFENLLAAEQGEAPVHHHAIDISDEIIERIAAGVAERLSQGVLIDTVTRIVSEVSERLVREEIARIRASAHRRNT